MHIIQHYQQGNLNLVFFFFFLLFFLTSPPIFSLPPPKLQTLLRLNVSQVQVDECARTDCKRAGGCSTQLSVSDSPTLVDSGALSLVSMRVTPTALCGCAAREVSHHMCSSYPTNPCLNGGTCIDTQNGYRWEACRQLSAKFWDWKKGVSHMFQDLFFYFFFYLVLFACLGSASKNEPSSKKKESHGRRVSFTCNLTLTCMSNSAVCPAEYRVESLCCFESILPYMWRNIQRYRVKIIKQNLLPYSGI